MHDGHRQRMMERLVRAGDSLQTHELLEILLYNAIPRKNTNDVAHRLLDCFGSLSGVLNAEIGQLTTVEGVGQATAEYLRCASLVLGRVGLEQVRELPEVLDFQDLVEFLRRRFRNADREYIEFYPVDARGKMTHIVRFTSDESNRARMTPEDLGKFFTEFHPRALVVAHNHLNANSSPSAADDAFTKKIQIFCSFHNLKFYDHIIVSTVDCYSYNVHGALDAIKRRYSMQNILDKVDDDLE